MSTGRSMFVGEFTRGRHRYFQGGTRWNCKHWYVLALVAWTLTVLAQCPTFAQHLSQPGNLAYGSNGELFVTNLGTNDIAVFQSNGSYVGSFSVAGTWRLTLDNSQNLYVAAGSDVIAYNTSGMPLRTIANGFGDAIATTRRQELISVENGVVTIFDRKGQSIFSYTQDQQGLQFAGGSMAIDRRTLYYATGPKGAPSVIVKYKLADFVTGTPNELVSFPNHGAYNPTQIAVDSRKCVYVVGYANTNGRGARTMIKMDPTGHIVLHISNLAFAYGVALDPAGNIYISENDNNDVKVFNSAGVLINTIQ